MSTSSRSSDTEGADETSPPYADVLIGRVSSAHGLQGEINVVPLTDFPERFQGMDSISLYREGRLLRVLKVLGVRHNGRGSLTLRTDLKDRDEAEGCVGAEIRIDPDERVALPPDSFWVDDLIGLSVEDDRGRPLGRVTDFLSGGANELYEVRDPEGRLHYIPAVDEFVRDIDIGKGLLRVSLIEGLWD